MGGCVLIDPILFFISHAGTTGDFTGGPRSVFRARQRPVAKGFRPIVIVRVAVGCPPLKDEDPVDALDTEVTKIIKKLAEARRAALAQFDALRCKKV
jgi:hypothetical protein